jgi:hypothetical protein
MAAARIAFFTGGTTGAGHFARGIAIERALARVGIAARYAIFTPRLPFAIARRPGVHAVKVDPAELLDPRRARESELAMALAAYAPDVLIADLFWAPLRLLLPIAGCEAWLLLRRVPPQWFAGPPGHPYERSRFDRVIAIEPGLPGSEVDETIDPIIVTNPDECRPPGSLRNALGLHQGERLNVVQQAGQPGEWLSLLASLTDRPAHVFTPARDDVQERAPAEDVMVHDGGAFFPLADWLRDADAIVAGAGYNAYWESRWLELDARSTFVPFRRIIDDQNWRLQSCGSHRPRQNGADVLARRLG